jgi:glucokinase
VRQGTGAVLDRLRATIDEAAGTAPSAIGVACAGQIDAATGAVVEAPNLGWRDVPLAEELRRAFGVPVAIENDVRAAAWGEFRFGTGRGADSLVAVFVGTGVGSGAVLGGKLWRGAGNAAGEVGHTEVVRGGIQCPCGARGCLERYVSGSGFQQRLREAAGVTASAELMQRTQNDPSRLTAVLVHEGAGGGDPFALTLWNDAELYLGQALANYVTLVNPAVLVLGGGVVETVPALFDAAVAGVMARTTTLARASLRIERAQLGDWSGVAGAADLARQLVSPP